MNSNVLVKVQTLIMNEGEEANQYEVLLPGQFVEKESAAYLIYEEDDPETGGTMRTKLKIRDTECVELSRKGKQTAYEILFTTAREVPVAYQTPYGVLDMQVRTNSIELDRESGHFTLRISYEVIMNGEPAGSYYMVVSVLQPNKSEVFAD